jgi:hypothetical protein
MPKNKACPGVPRVSDLITDTEMAFARLVLSGTMTDREAAQTAGLNPDTAAYTKAKPRVYAYMLERRAAMQQQLVDQEADEQRRKDQWRKKVLDRLWEIAALPAEVTRGSITGQVKAISMIMAIEGLIPDRRAGSSQKTSAPPLPQADIYPVACPPRPAVEPAVGLREQEGKSIHPEPDPAPAQKEEEPGPAGPEPTPATAAHVPPPPAMPIGPAYDRSESVFANLFHPAETTSWAPHAPVLDPAPDTRVPFSIKKNPFARRR